MVINPNCVRTYREERYIGVVARQAKRAVAAGPWRGTATTRSPLQVTVARQYLLGLELRGRRVY